MSWPCQQASDAPDVGDKKRRARVRPVGCRHAFDHGGTVQDRRDPRRGGTSDPHRDAQVIAAVVEALQDNVGGGSMATQIAELACTRSAPGAGGLDCHHALRLGLERYQGLLRGWYRVDGQHVCLAYPSRRDLCELVAALTALTAVLALERL
jgi:hypothetical protein